MKVDKVNNVDPGFFKKFQNGAQSVFNAGFNMNSQQDSRQQSHQEKSDGEKALKSVALTQEHLNEVENITKFLESMINTPLNFHCLWREKQEAYEICFSDKDTQEVLMMFTIPAFVKMVESFVFARIHGQPMSPVGNLLSIKV